MPQYCWKQDRWCRQPVCWVAQGPHPPAEGSQQSLLQMLDALSMLQATGASALHTCINEESDNEALK